MRNCLLFQVTRKQCYELYRQKWQSLSDSKKLKYILKAEEAFDKYEVSYRDFGTFLVRSQIAELIAELFDDFAQNSKKYEKVKESRKRIFQCYPWQHYVCYLWHQHADSKDG